jgi:K+-sensing histidine kinase KdpD
MMLIRVNRTLLSPLAQTSYVSAKDSDNSVSIGTLINFALTIWLGKFVSHVDNIQMIVEMTNRVLVVVLGTGPGIPGGVLSEVFNRFYSERLENVFGKNSELGLAVSKQIVEAHDCAMRAENIRPIRMDETFVPLGARFVIGLPL